MATFHNDHQLPVQLFKFGLIQVVALHCFPAEMVPVILIVMESRLNYLMINWPVPVLVDDHYTENPGQ